MRLVRSIWNGMNSDSALEKQKRQRCTWRHPCGNPSGYSRSVALYYLLAVLIGTAKRICREMFWVASASKWPRSEEGCHKAESGQGRWTRTHWAQLNCLSHTTCSLGLQKLWEEWFLRRWGRVSSVFLGNIYSSFQSSTVPQRFATSPLTTYANNLGGYDPLPPVNGSPSRIWVRDFPGECVRISGSWEALYRRNL